MHTIIIHPAADTTRSIKQSRKGIAQMIIKLRLENIGNCKKTLIL